MYHSFYLPVSIHLTLCNCLTYILKEQISILREKTCFQTRTQVLQILYALKLQIFHCSPYIHQKYKHTFLQWLWWRISLLRKMIVDGTK